MQRKAVLQWCSGRLYLQQKAAPAAEGCAVTEAAGYLDRQRSQTKSTNKAFNSGYTTTSIN